ncbi:MAG: asparagine synthase-related protein [Acidimicrobiales bacterium]
MVLPALQRPPCLVDFSGGRDSSLVLAVATSLARREGLPLPVPRTRRFLSDPASKEDEWQEMVVRHLRLPDWEVAGLTGELDIVGERAQSFLRRYGLLFPAPLYVLTESLGLAQGGSRLTGEGGDEVFGERRASFVRFAIESPGRLRRRRTLKAIIRNVAPRPARSLLLWYEYSKTLPCASWLRPGPARRVAREMALSDGNEPLQWGESLRWFLGRRVIAAHSHNVAIIAADHDVLHLDPLLDRGFVASLARCGGRYGFATRTQAMKFMAQDLLPQALLERRSKPIFNTAYFTATARSFAEGWDGSGVDDQLVDPEKLRAEWLSDLPAAPSFLLLQAAWLAQQSKWLAQQSKRTGKQLAPPLAPPPGDGAQRSPAAGALERS